MEKKYPIEHTADIPQSRLLAERFFDEELAKITDVTRKHEVSQEKETWIGCFMAGYKEGQAGPRWAKASERLPLNRKWNYIFRQAGNSRSATVIYLDHVDNICEYMKLPIDNIEWLEESGQ